MCGIESKMCNSVLGFGFWILNPAQEEDDASRG